MPRWPLGHHHTSCHRSQDVEGPSWQQSPKKTCTQHKLCSPKHLTWDTWIYIYIYVNILYILYRYIFLHIMVLSWYTWLYLSAFWSSIFMPQYHGAFFFQAPGFNHLSAPPSPPKRQSGCPFSIPLPYATSSRAGLPGFPNAQLRGNAIAGWSFIQKSSHEHWEF